MKYRAALTLGLLTWLTPLVALAWDPFRSPNAQVEEGNALLAQDKTADALEAYTRAAKELPDSAGVHLNRGLALSKAGDLEAAGEAFEQATRGRGSAKVRADSYYNLGRTRFAQANAIADAGDLKGAQSRLGDARDALRQALRAQPGSRDAAWNLEIVQRRMVELKEEQQKQEQEQQDQQDQGQQDQQDQEQDPQQGQEPQQPDQGDESQDQEDESQPKGGPEEDAPSDDSGQAEQDPDQADQPESGEQAEADEPPSPEPEPQEPSPQQPPPGDAPNEPLPQHVRQVLDSLQDGEETLQRHQAHSRARSRPRRVEKDW